MAGMAKAVNGNSGTAASKGLSLAKQKELTGEIDRLKAIAEKGKAKLAEAKALAEANGAHVAGQLVSFAEVQVAAGGSSLLHGYLADGKYGNTYRIGRGLTALLLTGAGTYRAFTTGQGQHLMSVAGGLAAAEASYSAFNFGRKWAAKRAGNSQAAAPNVVVTPEAPPTAPRRHPPGGDDPAGHQRRLRGPRPRDLPRRPRPDGVPPARAPPGATLIRTPPTSLPPAGSFRAGTPEQAPCPSVSATTPLGP